MKQAAATQPGWEDRRENSPALRLLKMSPKGMAIMGAGGRVDISVSDVAASLACLSPVAVHNAVVGEHHRTGKPITQLQVIHQKLSSEAYYFALAKYLDDKQAAEITRVNIWAAAMMLAKQEGWRIRAGVQAFRNASQLALGKHLDTQTFCLCMYCNGAGQTQRGVECRRCGGTGKRELKDAELARIVGVSQSNYQAVWVPRVEAISQILHGWDREVISHLYHQFCA